MDAVAARRALFQSETFDFDEAKHPRDSHGRFGEGDGPPTIKIPPLPLRTDPGARGHAVDKAVSQLVREGKDTETEFDKVNNQQGVYLPDRHELHEQIVDDMLARAVANGAEKGNEAILMGGLPGAGKSTATRDLFDSTRFVTINPDDAKAELVARGMAPKVEGMGPMEGVGLIHEESSTISSMLATKAIGQGYNILYDVTMGKAKSVDDRLATVAGGYHTTGVFVDVSPQLSAQSVEDRYATALAFESDKARYVPSEVIRNSVDPTGQYQSINRAVFEQTKPRLDNWAIYARTTSSDMHLVEASPGTIDRLRAL